MSTKPASDHKPMLKNQLQHRELTKYEIEIEPISVKTQNKGMLAYYDGHKNLILTAGSVLGVVIAVAYYARTKPKY